ncbi:MAG TPA: PKD domain-containing protein [Solirubrobacterales bacterium]|nr:PKD domain-containing protein [Solirubrobacterales bacterium]
MACAWLALAASASAAPTWLAPQDISGSTESTAFPEVSVNAAGDAVAIWYRDVGSKTIVEAVERPAGGDWSEPVVLSDPAGEDEPTNTHVALDTAGNAVAIWSVFDSPHKIRTAVRPAGGEWSDPEDLFTADGRTPQLAMNVAGDAVAVWNGFNGADDVTWAATRPAGGDWAAPADLSVTGEADWSSPEVSIDGAGNAIAVWERQIPGDNVVRAAILPAGDVWSTPEDLSVAGENAGGPRIVMNEAGAAVAAWGVIGSGIKTVVRSPDGGWSASPQQVSAPGQSAGEPELAIDSNGTAFAIWQGSGATGQVLRAAVLPSGGGWSAPKEVSADELGFVSYDLEAHTSAGVVATWTRKVSLTPTYGVQAAVRPPGGGWSEPEDLSAAGENAGLPDLDFNAAGDAVAIWGREVGVNDYILQGGGYDFDAPRLDNLRIPATGTAGQPVSFAVSPFDVFALGATSWAFGDGSQAASGNSVSHVYNAPGRYPVSVSALDASGNASTQAQAITIVPGPIGPPPPRRQIELAIRTEGGSLRKLLRTGILTVAASVNEAANVALSGQARIKAGARGAARTKLVQVFAPITVRFAAAAEGRVTLALSKRGRKALRYLSRVKLLIAGEAHDDVGGTATQTVAHTLR